MLLLYARGSKGTQSEPIRGRTRLMKMLFLFDREIRRKFNLEQRIPDEVLPDFSPYDFGPFSAQVFNDLEFLVDAGFVQVSRPGDAESLPEEGLEYAYWRAGAGAEDGEEESFQEEEFALTELGREFVEAGEAGELTDAQWRVLDEFKKRMISTPLRAILRYVYSKYPKMTTQSRIRDEILANSQF